MSTSSILKGAMIGIAVGVISDVAGRWIPQAKAV